jgi:hypothetical protein
MVEDLLNWWAHNLNQFYLKNIVEKKKYAV